MPSCAHVVGSCMAATRPVVVNSCVTTLIGLIDDGSCVEASKSFLINVDNLDIMGCVVMTYGSRVRE